MLDRKDVHWDSVRLRKTTREFVSQLAQGTHDPRIRYIVLFGSEARGEARLTSDVDIAVISDELIPRDVKLSIVDVVDEELELSVDYRLVTVTTPNLYSDNPMRVGYHIKREGLLIYERDA